jgi:hypothetical protein
MAARHEESISESGSKEVRLFDDEDRLVRTYIGYSWIFIMDSFGDWVAQLGHRQICPKCGRPQVEAKPGMAAKFEYQLDDNDAPRLHCEHCGQWSRLDVDWKSQILGGNPTEPEINANPTTAFQTGDSTPPDIGYRRE